MQELPGGRLASSSLAICVWALVLLAAAGCASSSTERQFRGSTPPGDIALPDFRLHEHTGNVVDSRALHGQVVLVTFLDTQCTEACPVIAGHIGRGLDVLDASERSRVVALAVTTDPEEDTPASVRAFHSAPVRIFDSRGVWVSTLHAGVDLTPENLANDLRVALG